MSGCEGVPSGEAEAEETRLNLVTLKRPFSEDDLGYRPSKHRVKLRHRPKPGDASDWDTHKTLVVYKESLKIKCGTVSEEVDSGRRVLRQQVFTEVQHEVIQMEADSKKKSIQETVIRCSDIFKPLPTKRLLGAPLRVVLTVGVAGVGKTFSVLKFCLDWAQGSEDQELQLVVLLSFREMNLLTTSGRYSLMELIQAFHPELPPHALSHSKVLIICDGLDESCLPLDFGCEVVSEVTQRSEVSVLLVNLIRGHLLPHAQIWITSRPAAAGQIPAQSVDRVTEVRGFFTDDQKEQFFRTRLSYTDMYLLRSSRSLYNMCQIPLFSSITATVLEYVLKTRQRGPLPQTLTELYAHFLLVKILSRKTTEKSLLDWVQKFNISRRRLSRADCELLLKLGRLAFEQLQKGNIMFYQEDLEQVGLDLSEALFVSEIIKGESIFDRPVYSFFHLSLQEFMAAVYVHHSFRNNTDELKDFLNVGEGSIPKRANEFLKLAFIKSQKSPNDLFVRFLHGLSLESNHRPIGALLSPVDQSEITKVIENLKEMNSERVSVDRSINIFHCLVELKDQSVQQQIQDLLRSGDPSQPLSGIHCLALAYLLQMSEQVLEELDLNKYNTTHEGRWRLIPAVRNCRTALLSDCGLTETHCAVVSSALSSESSVLRELDLSGNCIQDRGVKVLSEGLRSPHCFLEVLRLRGCGLTERGVSALGSALGSVLGSFLGYSWVSKPSSLRVLDLSENPLKDEGVKCLCVFLRSKRCRLETLSLKSCGLSDLSCQYLVSALESNLTLEELDLRENNVTSEGEKKLRDFLTGPGHRRIRIRIQDDVTLIHQGDPSLCHDVSKMSGRFSPEPCISPYLWEESQPGSSWFADLPISSDAKAVTALDEASRIRSNLPSSCSRSSVEALPVPTARLKLERLEGEPSQSRLAKQTGEVVFSLLSSFKGPSLSSLETSGSERLSSSESPAVNSEPHKESSFTPEKIPLFRDLLYRFRCPSSGAFRCSSTGLVFVVSKEVELQYRTVQWDESVGFPLGVISSKTVQRNEKKKVLLQSSGRTPAGPLYDIECSEGAVCELHLPHCEPETADVSQSQLSVAHFSDSDEEFIEPVQITNSHVIIKVSKFSEFGLTAPSEENKPISGQVLLFRTPKEVKEKLLYMFLLPRNVPLETVAKRRAWSTTEFIDAPSKCKRKLVIDRLYSVTCPSAESVQPKEALFDMDNEPNYPPTFQLRFSTKTVKASLKLKEAESPESEVWECDVCFTDSAYKIPIPNPRTFVVGDLELVRPRFIKNVSDPILDQLLDRLLANKYLIQEEMDTAKVKPRADKARYVLDTVKMKGSKAAAFLIENFCELDSQSELCEELQRLKMNKDVATEQSD